MSRHCRSRILFQPVGEALKSRLDRLERSHPDLAGRRARFHSLEAFRLTGYRKVLFCDSDMLFRRSAEALLARPDPLLCCGDAAFQRGAARDAASFAEIPAASPAHAGDLLARPFNAGFLLIDRSLLSTENHEALLTCLESTDWTGVTSGHTDQVVLNRALDGRQTLIDPAWNYLLAFHDLFAERCGSGPGQAAVIHFNGPVKPWLAAPMAERAAVDGTWLAAGRMWNQAYWDALAAIHLRRVARPPRDER